MATGTINTQTLSDIADAIRSKSGSSDTFKPSEMAQGIIDIPSGGITPTGTVNIATNGTHDVTNYASANVNVGGVSLPLQFDLLGTWTFENKEEWTNTSTADTMSTGFSFTGDTEHIYYICTVECDGTLDTSNANNWGGLTIMFGGKYQKGRASGAGRYFHAGNVQIRGVDKPMTYDDTEGSSDPVSNIAYGIWVNNTSASLTVNRKAHSTNCPKIMGGNYTVKLYGIKAI